MIHGFWKAEESEGLEDRDADEQFRIGEDEDEDQPRSAAYFLQLCSLLVPSLCFELPCLRSVCSCNSLRAASVLPCYIGPGPSLLT